MRAPRASVAQTIREQLRDGETLLWTGAPDPSKHLSPREVYAMTSPIRRGSWLPSTEPTARRTTTPLPGRPTQPPAARAALEKARVSGPA